MTDLKALIYVEIDIKFCSLTYGTSPCTAAIGVTGSEKCFNTRNRGADCQDPTNFSQSTKTVRFGLHDVPWLPADIPCIPLLRDAPVQPAVYAPGESLGESAVLTASFINSRHSDNGFDKYIVDRSYDPFEQGTFWGKFRARNTYLESRPIRVYRGHLGQSLSEMDCEHFFIEKIVGPDSDGNVTITGVDFLSLLNREKAQAPTPNSGYLDADLSLGSTSFTVLPAGIGDEEYPASGTAVLGKELITFTRANDVFTCSATTAAHQSGDVVQLPLIFTSKNIATIINTLVSDYTILGSDYFDNAAAQTLVSTFANVLYSRTIPKPEPVRDLLDELIQQGGLVMGANTRTQKFTFDVLRPNPTTGLIVDADEVIGGTFTQRDQPKKRYSSVWVFYGKRDIFEDDEPTNFLSAVIFPAEDNQYDTSNIRKIFSKWIPGTGLTVATDVASRAIARYQFPPVLLEFELFAKNTRQLGQVVNITDPTIETATGAQGTKQAIITSWEATTEGNAYVAEEYNIDAESFEGDIIIQFDYDSYNLNLRAQYDELYSSIDESTAAPDIIFIINDNVVVGSTSVNVPAIVSGTWPVGVEPILQINTGAYVVGKGGLGALFGGNGGPGGTALEVTSAMRVDNRGTVGGGGGGGGGAENLNETSSSFYGGGGGAGRDIGIGADADVGTSRDGQDGTLTTGGLGGGAFGGDGGDLGQAGEDAPGGNIAGTGGAAGSAIEGNSLITFIAVGSILGAQNG